MSNVVTFQDALQTLQSMFSHVSRAQIKQILLSHRGVMERAVDTLLQIPEPSPQALQEAAQTLDLDTKIRELEAQKLKFIQREQFLQAEEIKNRLTALRAERANRRQQAQHSHHQPHLQYEHTSQPAPTSSNVGTSSNNADARPNPFNTDFDELTPLFLRKRSRQRRELPEFFLRSPAFRRAAIQNKILASEMALQIHDEMHQEDIRRRTNQTSQSLRGQTLQAAGSSSTQQGNKASLWFKNLGAKAKVSFQKFKESLKQKPGDRRVPKAVTNSEKVVLDDGVSPSARARTESSSEYTAMDDNGEHNPFSDEDDDFDGSAGGSSAARNQMLWRMNRKPAGSIRGFEMKDIGSSSANTASAGAAPADSFGREGADVDDTDDGLGDSSLLSGSRRGGFVDVSI